jgi:hypothetical protein
MISNLLRSAAGQSAAAAKKSKDILVSATTLEKSKNFFCKRRSRSFPDHDNFTAGPAISHPDGVPVSRVGGV